MADSNTAAAAGFQNALAYEQVMGSATERERTGYRSSGFVFSIPSDTRPDQHQSRPFPYPHLIRKEVVTPC